MEHFGEGAIIADENGQWLYWNPAARRMHGLTASSRHRAARVDATTFQLWTPDGSRMLELDEWPVRRIKRGETVDHLELRLASSGPGLGTRRLVIPARRWRRRAASG